MSYKSRVDRLEAGMNSDGSQLFAFGCEYLIVREEDPDQGLMRQERSEYSFCPPTLLPGEYVASETPVMVTQAAFNEAFAAIKNTTRTLT